MSIGYQLLKLLAKAKAVDFGSDYIWEIEIKGWNEQPYKDHNYWITSCDWIRTRIVGRRSDYEQREEYLLLEN